MDKIKPDQVYTTEEAKDFLKSARALSNAILKEALLRQIKLAADTGF